MANCPNYKCAIGEKVKFCPECGTDGATFARVADAVTVTVAIAAIMCVVLGVSLWGCQAYRATVAMQEQYNASPMARHGRVPAGCTAKAGTVLEPYTKSGWVQAVVHDKTGIELVYIPAGSFTMGSPADEAGRSDNEVQHRVTLSQGFYMGKYEVTYGQWWKVMQVSLSDQVRKALADNTVYAVINKTIRDFYGVRTGMARIPRMT